MNSASKPRRTLGLEGLKLLMGTGAMAATIGLWSIFAHRDLVNQLAGPGTIVQASGMASLDFPPIPTLVPFDSSSFNSSSAPTPLPTSIDLQNLRTVSAPSQPAPSSANSPRVVGGSGGGGSVTTTRSS